MTLEEKQAAIVDEFAMFDDWMQKYEYLIELGKDLPKIDAAKKTEDKLIEGCQSKVWLDSKFEDGVMRFTADSDGIIPKGIISLLVRVLDGEKPESIVQTDLHFIKDIEIQEHLMVTRSNGLLNMIKRMKSDALKNCK